MGRTLLAGASEPPDPGYGAAPPSPAPLALQNSVDCNRTSSPLFMQICLWPLTRTKHAVINTGSLAVLMEPTLHWGELGSTSDNCRL